MKKNNNITNIGETLQFADGTKYMRMPNGELRRMSPRAFKLEKLIRKK